MNGSFDAETAQLLDETREVQIETRRDENAPMHRTIIWVVTLEGTVFVRSVRGEKGRWYREVSANPSAALHVGDRRIPVRAVPVTEEQAVSEAYRSKYGRTAPASTEAMLRPETLPTTLRLEPV
ncbi:MAG TPA: nitroreductase/quinone reductase family protein [Rubrobacteraceae bacterium]|nr:nitroreductase/quinone reductase family protein [Rubrobacteraceae bacterium]